MSIPTLTVKGYSTDEIKRMLSENESFVIAIRLYLVYQVSMGYSSRKLSEINNMSFKQITTWVHRFEKEGIEGLRDRKGRGRKSNLSDKKLQRIKNVVLKESPLKHGFTSKRWTGPLIAEWIESMYGVRYQKAQVYNLLKKLGIEFYKDKGLVSV